MLSIGIENILIYGIRNSMGSSEIANVVLEMVKITTFSLVPVKYGINFTAAVGIFAWAKKQVWYWIF